MAPCTGMGTAVAVGSCTPCLEAPCEFAENVLGKQGPACRLLGCWKAAERSCAEVREAGRGIPPGSSKSVTESISLLYFSFTRNNCIVLVHRRLRLCHDSLDSN